MRGDEHASPRYLLGGLFRSAAGSGKAADAVEELENELLELEAVSNGVEGSITILYRG
jgi:hypothetical protein